MVGYEMLGEASNRKEFMKILVTGGAGYIGSVVVEQLIAAGVGEVRFYILATMSGPA
jgi:FlaA1/EpsC-like NDP-sugar epimerase